MQRRAPHATSAAYGSWRSPVTPDLLARGLESIGELAVDGRDIWWAATQPVDKGRTTLLRWREGSGAVERLPEAFSVQSKVYEYGGSAWCVSDEVVHFVNGRDQRIYQSARDTKPVAITAADSDTRYGDLASAQRPGTITAVRESDDDREPRHDLVVITSRSGECANVQVLVSGPDFVWNARVSPDGALLAWIQWSHPRMPWEAAELWIGRLSSSMDAVTEHTRLAGGLGASVFQPEWSADGRLHFLSEVSGWWNLYRADPCTSFRGPIEHLAPMTREVGIYAPCGVVGVARYAILADQSAVMAYVEDGCDHLGAVSPAGSGMLPVRSPFTLVSQIRATPTGIVLSGCAFTSGWSVVHLELGAAFAIDATEVLRQPPSTGLRPSDISYPESVYLPTRDGASIHAFFYRPMNADYAGPSGDLPPLLVVGHGGPTDAATSGLNLPIQFWTSRGFAVLDVNYRGSTGFGRDYREALNGNWGILDVTDCIDATAAIVASGDVDASRIGIRGGSAGGFTTLCALAFHDVFHVGVSRYGVSDLKSLADQTHKFESRLLDSLVGALPQAADLYRERSPLFHADNVSCPVLLVQGLDDVIVPPNQAEHFVDALDRNGIAHGYLAIPGEGHGFRDPINAQRALEAELYFYSKVFGFELLEDVAPIPLRHL